MQMTTPYFIDRAAELKCRGIVQQEQLSYGICVCLTKARTAHYTCQASQVQQV